MPRRASRALSFIAGHESRSTRQDGSSGCNTDRLYAGLAIFVLAIRFAGRRVPIVFQRASVGAPVLAIRGLRGGARRDVNGSSCRASSSHPEQELRSVEPLLLLRRASTRVLQSV